LERLETNNALQASDPADAGVIGKIEAFREAVTQNFDTGLGGIRIQDFPNKSEVLQSLESALEKANDYRRRADEAIRLPRERRDLDVVEGYIPVLTSCVRASIKVWYAALHGFGKNHSQFKQLADIKAIGWRMREYSGLERSIVASAIAAGTRIPEGELPAIAAHRTRVALLWEQLQNLTAGPDTHPAVIGAMRAAEKKYFKDFLSLSDQMRRVSDVGGSYPLAAAQWVEITNPQLGALLAVLDAASTASEALTDGIIQRSVRALEITGAMLILSVRLPVFASGSFSPE